GRFLDVAVDARDDLPTWIRLLAPHDLNRPAQRIDLDALAAVRPAQVFIQEAFETGLADQVATPGSPLLHLLLVHLANVAEQVRRERRRGIDTLGLDLDDHARQFSLPLFDPGDLLERESPTNANGPK